MYGFETELRVVILLRLYRGEGESGEKGRAGEGEVGEGGSGRRGERESGRRGEGEKGGVAFEGRFLVLLD